MLNSLSKFGVFLYVSAMLTLFPFALIAQEQAPEPNRPDTQEVLPEAASETKPPTPEEKPQGEPQKEPSLPNQQELPQGKITSPESTTLKADLNTDEGTHTTTLDVIPEKSGEGEPSTKGQDKKPVMEQELSVDLETLKETRTPSLNISDLSNKDQLVQEKMILDSMKESSALSKSFNSQLKNFVFTDENENENLIIRSDKRDYVGLAKQEVFFSVTNKGTSSEMVNVQAYFPHEQGEVIALEQWVEDIPMKDGKAYLSEERIECVEGWEPMTLSSDISLTMGKRYFKSLFASFTKTSRVFAQALEILLAPKANAPEEIEQKEETPEPAAEEKIIENSEEENESPTEEEQVTASEEGLAKEESQGEPQEEAEASEEGVYQSEELQEGEAAQEISEQEQIEQERQESTEASLENESTREPQEVGTSESNLEASETPESKGKEFDPAQSKEEVSQEPAPQAAPELFEIAPPLEQRFYCAKKDLDQDCRYLADQGKTCVSPIKNEERAGFSPGKKLDTWKSLTTSTQKLKPSNTLLEKVLGTDIKAKAVPGHLSVKKASRIDRRNPYIKALEPGETSYYKMTIAFPIGSDGEFYIEAIGDKNGYGLLDPFWNSTWDYKQIISVDNTASTEALNDYQIFVDLDASNSNFWAHVKSDGGDVRFIDTTETTELDFFMLHFNYARQSAQFWVKVDQIPASGSRDIFLYYGNPSASTSSSAENTFSYPSKQPRFYPLTNPNATADALGVTFFDNNEFELGSLSDTDWDTGTVENPKTITVSNFNINNPARSTKPIALDAPTINLGEMWAPAAWQSKVFVVPTPRYKASEFYLTNPSITDAQVTFKKNGALVHSLTLPAGQSTAVGASSISSTEGNWHWRIDSDVPILAAVHSTSTSRKGISILRPPSTEIYGTLTRSIMMVIACLENVTSFTLYFSNGATHSGTCNATKQYGYNTTYYSPEAIVSYHMVSDKPLTIITYDWLLKLDFIIGYPPKEFDTEYVIPNSYLTLFCAAPYSDTTINVYNLGGSLVVSSGNLGTTTEPFPLFWSDTVVRTGAHRVTSNKPIFCNYQDTTSGKQLRNLHNRILNRKPAAVEPVVSLSPVIGTSFPKAPEIYTPFKYEKVPSLNPSFIFTSENPKGGTLSYDFRIDTDENFSSPIVRNSANDAGFENIDTPSDLDPFFENQKIQFTLQSGDSLANGSTYWYQVRAKNLNGDAGDWSAKRSFSVDSSINHSTWHQTTDEQFNKNILSSISTTGSDSVLVDGSDIPYIKVQHIDVTLEDNVLYKNLTLESPVSDIQRAFILLQGGETTVYSPQGINPQIADIKASVHFLDNETVQIVRSRAAFAQNFTIQIIEADSTVESPAFSVQHGNAITTSETTNLTINAVDVGQSIVLLSNDSALNYQARHSFLSGKLTSPTTLTVSLGLFNSSSPPRAYYQVVTFSNDFSIQKGEITVPTSQTTANKTINTLDRSRSMIFTDFISMEFDLDRSISRLWLSTNTTVNIEFLYSSSLNERSIPFSIIEFPASVVVQADNNVNAPTIAGTTNVTLSPPVNKSHSFVNMTARYTGSYGNTTLPTSYLSTSTNLRFRGGESNTSYVASYYVADTSLYKEPFDGIGSVVSPEISFTDGNRDTNNTAWSHVDFNTNETNGDIKVQVYTTTTTACDTLISDTDLPGNSSGFDSTIDISQLNHLQYGKICLKGIFTEGVSGSPELFDWTVSWGRPLVFPDTPSITEPFDFEKVPITTPSFDFSTTEADGDDIVYQFEWSTDQTFATTHTVTSDVDPGFENLDNPSDTSPFTQGQNIRFTIQAGDALSNGGTYWYRVRAKDPADSNLYSDWSVPRSLTIDTAVTNSTWHQTTDEQFNLDTMIDTKVTGNGSVVLNLMTGGNLTSSEINFNDGDRGLSNSAWKEVSFHTDETTGDIKLQLYSTQTTSCDNQVSDTDLPGNSSGFDSAVDISGLNTTTYSKLCLKAIFTDSGTGSPKLLDWTVTWGAAETAPTVSTQAVSSITKDTAVGNGNVSDDGGAAITERGVVWNTTGTPTTADASATSTGSTGAFTASMTGLSSSTQYFVRAYAINSVGTSYGNEVSFTTKDPQTLSFSLSGNDIGFGGLSPALTRYASSGGAGSSSPVIAHSMSIQTNAQAGYAISVSGSPLSCLGCGSGQRINEIGAIPATPNPGTEQFGLRATPASGNGSVASPYNQPGSYAYEANASPGLLANGPGDNTLSTFDVYYMANIAPTTGAGDYQSIVTYTVTANF